MNLICYNFQFFSRDKIDHDHKSFIIRNNFNTEHKRSQFIILIHSELKKPRLRQLNWQQKAWITIYFLCKVLCFIMIAVAVQECFTSEATDEKKREINVTRSGLDGETSVEDRISAFVISWIFFHFFCSYFSSIQ